MPPILSRPAPARIAAAAGAVVIGTVMLGGTIALCRTPDSPRAVPHICGAPILFLRP